MPAPTPDTPRGATAPSDTPQEVVHQTRFPVRYGESDQMGIVHHAVYVTYFELARTEAFKSWGVDYAELERAGTLLAVIAVDLKYRAPARFGETLVVETRLARRERIRLTLSYRVLRDPDGTLLCDGTTTLAALDPSMKPRRMPPDLIAALDRLS